MADTTIEWEVKRASCFLCHLNCGVICTKENGRIVKIEGDPDCPHNEGFVCARLEQDRWKDFVYNPNRLKKPLKRIGERGAGQWEEISWEQAFDEMAEKLAALRNEYGAETLCFLEGTYRTQSNLHYKFTNLFGTPNTGGNGTICYSSDMWLEPCTYGGFCSDKSDWKRADLIVLWGRNPAVSEQLCWEWVVKNIEERGAKLLVIDPRYCEAAQKADLYLQIRPGTDSALAMGFINIIIEEGLYDHEFVEEWCYGFEEIKERAKEYPVAKVSEITWISEEKIIEAARLYASIKPACMPWGEKGGDGCGVNATSAIRAKAILRAITGNIDVIGGDQLTMPSDRGDSDMQYNHNSLSQEQRDKMIGNNVHPGLTFKGWDLISKAYPRFYPYSNAPLMFRAMITGDPYPVKACIVQADNPMLSYSNSKLVYEALTSLELLIVNDFFMTPTAAIADYVLPAATWLERCSIGYPTMDVEQVSMNGTLPVLERFEGGADIDFRDDYEFWYGLSERLGFADEWWGPSMVDMFNDTVAHFGMNFKDFSENVKYLRVPNAPEKYKAEGFKFLTPTGKVELYSTIIEELGEGYDPLPGFEYPPYFPEVNPEHAEEYPLSMITGARFMPFYHTEHRQPGAYRDLHPDPIFDIHPDTAMKLNIASGDWCWIETPLGRIKQRARTTTILDPRVISVQHGWWFPELPETDLFGVFDSNINAILDDSPEVLDSLMGAWPNTGLYAKVYKVED
ncbi:MAG: molybdopterin-dependent oxidoreductase [Coriobacteriales bacterium]|jgi:anaerobic selenocysteine-containing dehydrogenase|nr:molybdopterin-dependent oxidoreductase [Coriobacteriales bacterium]